MAGRASWPSKNGNGQKALLILMAAAVGGGGAFAGAGVQHEQIVAIKEAVLTVKGQHDRDVNEIKDDQDELEAAMLLMAVKIGKLEMHSEDILRVLERIEDKIE